MNTSTLVRIQITYTLPDAPNQIREQIKTFEDEGPGFPAVQKYLAKWKKECGSLVVNVVSSTCAAEHPDPAVRRMQFRSVFD